MSIKIGGGESLGPQAQRFFEKWDKPLKEREDAQRARMARRSAADRAYRENYDKIDWGAKK